MITCKYNEFLLDKEFNTILFETLFILETKGEWVDNNTYEWNMEKKSKLKKFLEKLPKSSLKKYFYKLMSSLKKLPKNKRKRLVLSLSTLFFTFASISFYLPDGDIDKDYVEANDRDFYKELSNTIKEFSKVVITKAKFTTAQKYVKEIEKGYSNDRGDYGNFVKTAYGKRFVGSNYGISAPVLMEYTNKLPSKEDMINLKYTTALDIYKKKYWERQNLDSLNNQSIANIIYDGCVNQGINGMRKILRKAFNENSMPITSSENPFSEDFLNLVNEVDSQKLFNSIKKERIAKYKVSRTFKRHGKGWLKRVNSIKYSD